MMRFPSRISSSILSLEVALSALMESIPVAKIATVLRISVMYAQPTIQKKVMKIGEQDIQRPELL